LRLNGRYRKRKAPYPLFDQTQQTMYKKIISISFCLVLMPCLISAQQDTDRRQAIGLTLLVNHVKPLIIQKNFASTEANITSNSIPGFEGRLDYRFRIKNGLYFEGGLLFGLNPYRFDLFVSEDFADLPWGDHNDYYQVYEDNLYLGAALSLSYSFPVGNKSDIAAGIGVNYIYYIGFGSSSYGVSYSIDPNTQISVFSMTTSSNPEQVLIFPVEFRIRYNYLIGKRMLFSATLTWVPSDKSILTGNYTILGTDRSLPGTIDKRSGRAGLGIGGYYLF